MPKVKTPRNGKKIQSVIFLRRYWTIPKAKDWLRKNKFHTPKVDTTVNYYRFRQFNPRRGDEYITRNAKNLKTVKYIVLSRNQT